MNHDKCISTTGSKNDILANIQHNAYGIIGTYVCIMHMNYEKWHMKIISTGIGSRILYILSI